MERKLPSRSERKFVVVVSKEEAQQVPYPYVLVTSTGAVHELRADERTHLEAAFEPWDGGRPYVKRTYTSLNGASLMGGYCRPLEIPQDILINPQPAPRFYEMPHEPRKEWWHKWWQFVLKKRLDRMWHR